MEVQLLVPSRVPIDDADGELVPFIATLAILPIGFAYETIEFELSILHKLTTVTAVSTISALVREGALVPLLDASTTFNALFVAT